MRKRATNSAERLELQAEKLRLRQFVAGFKHKRIAKNLTQDDLAARLGVDQSAIARFESGFSNPTLLFMKRIAKALDVEIKIV